LYSVLIYCTVFVIVFWRARDPVKQPESRRPGPGGWIVQLLLVFVALAFVADGLVGDRGLLAMLRARQQHDELAASIARTRAENARLREEARRLREDPSVIEEIARRELGLIRPGETVFIVKDVSPSDHK
jgi:cell division protein FtsB